MEENKTKKETKKLSYDELQNAAHQMSVQLDAVTKENYMLRQSLQRMDLSNVYSELNLLFKVIELSAKFNNEFVEYCAARIEEAMRPKNNEAEEEPESGEDNK